MALSYFGINIVIGGLDVCGTHANILRPAGDGGGFSGNEMSHGKHRQGAGSLHAPEVFGSMVFALRAVRGVLILPIQVPGAKHS
jgi:hypothetical protein